MGAATYIGRVGGLAVALGVGTAIAAGQGVAAAETADQTSSNAEQSAGTSDATGTTTGTTATSTDSTVTTQTENSTADEPAETGGSGESENTSTTTSTVTDGVTISAQTNTGTSKTTASSNSEPPEEPESETTPAAAAEPTELSTPTEEPTPTEAVDPDPTPEAEPDPTESAGADVDSAVASTAQPNPTVTATPSEEQSTASVSARTVESFADPAATVQEPAKVAVFADARTLASVGPSNISPMATAQLTSTQAPAAASTAPADLFATVANVVSSTVNWILNPLAGTAPTTPAQPPLIWGLLAFARREFEGFFAALAGQSATPDATLAAQPTTTLALAAAAVADPLYLPFPNAQVSPSTQFVGWVTGPYEYPGNPLLGNTVDRYSVWGTDLGIMWDNGIPDDPTTPINEHQILIAVGDTFAGPNMTGDWRSNTIFRSSDTNLADGIEIPDGQWYTGNMFGGAPLGPDGFPTRARQVIFPEGLPAGVTLIPTAGVSVPTPGSRFGAVQYVSFMSVSQWGAPGSWTTNYSAIAWSDDNGETFHVAPQSVRYNQPWSGHQNFQQSAFVRPGDGYVYMYGTPNGRQGAAYLSRVSEQDVLNLSQYEYWNKGSAGGWFGWGATPAGWYKNDPAAATAVFGVDQGACGVANPGNQVSEMSVQYNQSLNKYVVLYGDQFNNVVMRTSDTPQGTWSSATVLMGQQNGGIYAPMLHPWSPSTQGTGSDLYWNLSLWSEYNVMLMRTDLTKL